MMQNSHKALADDEMKKIEIDFADDIEEGQMRELKVGDGERDKILISRYQG
jgi:hypothetical protein